MHAQCWEPGTYYNLGDVVEYEGHRYKIIQAHRSQGDWTPPVTPALWGRLSDQDYNDHQQQNQGEYQPQQPYQAQPQYAQNTKPESHGQAPEKHWYDDDETKKKLEIGGGLAAGAALLAGGLFAYKKHEEHNEENKAQGWARENWIQEARARTEAFHRQGYDALQSNPAVWLLNHGKTIPRDAICVGQEHSWSLYIGRAYVDGGLQLGKASDVFKKGGVIGYKNEEIHVEEYEILVGDLNRLVWVSASGRLNINELGHRPVEGGHENNGTRIYVAKAPHKDAVHPGKVGADWDGAYIPYDGKEKLVREYSVLCYRN